MLNINIFYKARKKCSFLFILSLVLSLIGCISLTNQQNYSNKGLNVNFLYNPNAYSLEANIYVFNVSGSNSELYCNIPYSTLTFYGDSIRFSNVLIKYILYKISKNVLIVDSSTVNHQIVFNKNKTDALIKLDLILNDTSDYMLDIGLIEVNTGKTFRTFYEIERSKKVNSNDFLALTKNGNIVFNGYIKSSDTIYFKVKKELPKTLRIAYFKDESKLASPPYSYLSKDYIYKPPDSIKVIRICDTCYFFLKKQNTIGRIFYDSISYGFTLYNFSDNFPNLKNITEMLQPLRLLTSAKEFNELVENSDKKEALDKFWLEISNSPERARELIRVFYTRTMLANKYFTSYTQGWKTDRGAIYILFGLPTAIYKSPKLEQWIYGNPSSPKALVFTFHKQYCEISNNHYVLERNEFYKIPWLQAVDTWRNGRIFTVSSE
ncbi:MAG: GWxTD domain-containing protein [Bacteroidales bacterium]|nr:GWxTD domain-containing protein [Bacteroidales bacterium]